MGLAMGCNLIWRLILGSDAGIYFGVGVETWCTKRASPFGVCWRWGKNVFVYAMGIRTLWMNWNEISPSIAGGTALTAKVMPRRY